MPVVSATFEDGSGLPDRDAFLRHGPCLDVHVAPLLHHGEPALRAPPAGALIDTGTQHDCIDNRFAGALGLPVVDTFAAVTAAGLHTVAVFAALVVVPRLAIHWFAAFVGIDFALGDVPHRVMLRRAFLEEVVMIYDGLRGQITFASSPDPC